MVLYWGRTRGQRPNRAAGTGSRRSSEWKQMTRTAGWLGARVRWRGSCTSSAVAEVVILMLRVVGTVPLGLHVGEGSFSFARFLLLKAFVR